MTWTWNRSWTVHRLLISAFLLAHLTATVVWMLPACPIRQRLAPWVECYILPTGMWQYWGMFAPDPVRDTSPSKPRSSIATGCDTGSPSPAWPTTPGGRGSPGSATRSTRRTSRAKNSTVRQFAARHVLRNLDLPARVFPVSVHLLYQIRADAPARQSRPRDRPDGPDQALRRRHVPVRVPSEVRHETLRAWNRFWFSPDLGASPRGVPRGLRPAGAGQPGVPVLRPRLLAHRPRACWSGAEAREVAGPLRFSPLQWFHDPTSVRVRSRPRRSSACCLTIGWRTRVMGVLFYLRCSRSTTATSSPTAGRTPYSSSSAST